MASNAENVSIWWRHHEICIGLGNTLTLNSRKPPPESISTVGYDAICQPIYNNESVAIYLKPHFDDWRGELDCVEIYYAATSVNEPWLFII